MKFCKRCVMPDSKPDLLIDDEGVCNACRAYENRKEVDWDKRKNELLELVDKYRSKNQTQWDCIVPVSGGKDSTFQVIRMLQLGMNPLCVTSETCDFSDLGKKNLQNLKNLGVDHIEFSPNPVVRKKLNRIGLTQVGDISWPEHVGIFTLPIQVAVNYKIPLIVWGENSQNEYGGPATDSKNSVLTRRWLEEFGGLLGLRVTDMVGIEGIQKKDLLPYTYPSDEQLKEAGVTGIFLGHYLPWDGYSNAFISQGFGFHSYETTIEGSVVNYENIDNYQTGIHDFFKFLKFGFGRGSDLASMHIRRGRITRQDGVQLVKIHDGKFPWTYLGKPLEEILKPLDITVDEFVKICDKFTNKKLFKTDSRGNLVKDKDLNLIKLYEPEF